MDNMGSLMTVDLWIFSFNNFKPLQGAFIMVVVCSQPDLVIAGNNYSSAIFNQWLCPALIVTCFCNQVLLSRTHYSLLWRVSTHLKFYFQPENMTTARVSLDYPLGISEVHSSVRDKGLVSFQFHCQFPKYSISEKYI